MSGRRQRDPTARASFKEDVVPTPEWVVHDMLDHFAPSGVILDPCRGDGVFHKNLPQGSPWCEVSDGVDFFAYNEPVDWIIGNPPYSITRSWFRHSFKIATNVLYILPLRHMFSAYGQLVEVGEYGGIKEVRLYGTGSRLGFPMGNAVGAVHIQRDYRGPTSWTDQQQTQDTLFGGVA
jgi:hypothetical protein